MDEIEKNRIRWGKNAFLPRRAHHSNDDLKFIDVRFLYFANICGY